MAAVTPTSIKQYSAGSLKGILAEFATTTNTGDTWSSGIKGIFGVIPVQTEAATTQASTGVGASFVASTSVITILLGENGSTVSLFVLATS